MEKMPAYDVTNTAVGPSAPPMMPAEEVPAQGKACGRNAISMPRAMPAVKISTAAVAAKTARASASHKKRHALPLYCPADAWLKGWATASGVPMSAMMAS